MYCKKCGVMLRDHDVFCHACGTDMSRVAGRTSRKFREDRFEEYMYAGFWLRFAAMMIDLMVCVVPTLFIVGIITAIFTGDSGTSEEPSPVMSAFLQVIMVLVPFLYFVLLESSACMATLGKMAVGAVVTDLRGRRISFGKATGRFFGKFMSCTTMYIGFIMASFTEKKQALHDIMMGSLVVRKRFVQQREAPLWRR